MAVVVNLKKGNLPKKGFVGFSWTTFFFNFFVPLLRGEPKWAGIMFATEAFLLPFSSFVASGGDEELLGLIYMMLLVAYRVIIGFVYNKRYTENLLKEGFEPVEESDRIALKFSGLYSE